jgi:hypothetical protein
MKGRSQMKSATLLIGVLALSMVAAMTGFTVTTRAQTLEEVQTSVGQLVEEAVLLSKALGEVGQESLLILKQCRIARWSLSRTPDSIGEAMASIAEEANTLGEQLDGILDEEQELARLIESPQALSSAVEGLMDDELLDGERGDLVQQKLLDLSDLAMALSEDVRSLQSKSADVKNVIYEAQTAAMATPPDLEVLRERLTSCVKFLLVFGRERRTVVLPKKAAIVRTVKEIRDLLSETGPLPKSNNAKRAPLSGYARSSREVTVLGHDVAAIRVQVYSPEGRLVLTREAPSRRLTLMDLHGDKEVKVLANGVYWYTVTALGSDGHVLKTEIRKLAVRR